MSPKPDQTDGSYRARVPADVDQPDKIVWGLTARQVAILSVAAVAAYGIFKAVGGLLPQPVLIALMVPLAGAAIVLALGRRDGLSLDAWLLAAVRHSRAPRNLAPAASGTIAAAPTWAPHTTAVPPAAVLRLPAKAISERGIIDTGSQSAALIACTTVNINLRTGEEQAALIGGFGRWLNSLSTPVQILISAQRVDLSSHAQRIADNAATIANQALAEAAHDYAAFLDDLATRRDPLWRTVTIAVTASGEKSRDNDAARRAEQTASALAALGVQTSILDGGRVTSVLTVAADPYTPADVSWARARPGAVISGALS